MSVLSFEKKIKTKPASKPWQEVKTEVLFPEGKPMSTEKKKDMMKICEILPPAAQEFIDKIVACDAIDFIDDVDGYSFGDIFDRD